MSGIITPEGLTREITTYSDPDNTYGEVGDGSSDNAKISKTNEGNWFKNLVLGVAQSVSYVWTFLSGISLTSGRVAFKELTSGTLSVSGWYTIAETLATPSEQPILAKFYCSVTGNGRRSNVSFNVNITTSSSAIRNKNYIEIIGISSYSSTFQAPSARIAYGNVSTAGIKIQIYIDVSTSVSLVSQISNMIAQTSPSNLNLVTPYLDDTPTLPDGVTSASIYEAGAEYKPNQGNTRLPKSSFTKLTDSTVRLTFDWGEIPKQGTSLGLTYTAMTLYDNSGASYTITGSETLGAISIDGKEVSVVMTSASAFTGLTAGGDIQATGFTATIS